MKNVQLTLLLMLLFFFFLPSVYGENLGISWDQNLTSKMMMAPFTGQLFLSGESIYLKKYGLTLENLNGNIIFQNNNFLTQNLSFFLFKKKGNIKGSLYPDINVNLNFPHFPLKAVTQYFTKEVSIIKTLFPEWKSNYLEIENLTLKGKWPQLDYQGKINIKNWKFLFPSTLVPFFQNKTFAKKTHFFNLTAFFNKETITITRFTMDKLILSLKYDIKKKQLLFLNFSSPLWFSFSYLKKFPFYSKIPPKIRKILSYIEKCEFTIKNLTYQNGKIKTLILSSSLSLKGNEIVKNFSFPLKEKLKFSLFKIEKINFDFSQGKINKLELKDIFSKGKIGKNSFSLKDGYLKLKKGKFILQSLKFYLGNILLKGNGWLNLFQKPISYQFNIFTPYNVSLQTVKNKLLAIEIAKLPKFFLNLKGGLIRTNFKISSLKGITGYLKAKNVKLENYSLLITKGTFHFSSSQISSSQFHFTWKGLSLIGNLNYNLTTNKMKLSFENKKNPLTSFSHLLPNFICDYFKAIVDIKGNLTFSNGKLAKKIILSLTKAGLSSQPLSERRGNGYLKIDNKKIEVFLKNLIGYGKLAGTIQDSLLKLSFNFSLPLSKLPFSKKNLENLSGTLNLKGTLNGKTNSPQINLRGQLKNVNFKQKNYLISDLNLNFKGHLDKGKFIISNDGLKNEGKFSYIPSDKNFLPFYFPFRNILFQGWIDNKQLFLKNLKAQPNYRLNNPGFINIKSLAITLTDGYWHFSGKAEGNNLELNDFLTANTPFKNSLYSTIQLEANFQGSEKSLSLFKAAGKGYFRDGIIKKFPPFQMLSDMIHAQNLKNEKIKQGNLNFKIANQKINLNFQVQTTNTYVKGYGDIGFDLGCYLKIKLSLSPAAFLGTNYQIPEDVLKDGTKFSIKVKRNLLNPKIVPATAFDYIILAPLFTAPKKQPSSSSPSQNTPQINNNNNNNSPSNNQSSSPGSTSSPTPDNPAGLLLKILLQGK